MSTEISHADLEAAYQQAMQGTYSPPAILVSRDDARAICERFSYWQEWFTFVKATLTSPASMTSRRLDPARLP